MRMNCLAQAHRLRTPWIRSVTKKHWPVQSRSFAFPSKSGTEPKSKANPDSSSTTRSDRHYESFPLRELERVVKGPALKYQIYISYHENAYNNLSIEHYLLQNTHPDSTILFFYVNGPCVVIGRNQNPWLETNLRSIIQSRGPMRLVRRRSGGGAVFHDQGNLNYSVICPPSEFTRDKHAQMVVSALRMLGLDNARVNERHDIVIDRPKDTGPGLASFKISGSAYKLTRQRALHHGTLLLTARLGAIGQYLNSPALPYIKARGVESVKSAVANVNSGVPGEIRQKLRILTCLAIVTQFASIYKLDLPSRYPNFDPSAAHDSKLLHVGDSWVMGQFPKKQRLPFLDREIAPGVMELTGDEWTFGQTPQFIFSTHPTDEDPRKRPELPSTLPSSTRIYLKIKNGVILDGHISFSADPTVAMAQKTRINERILGKSLLVIHGWKECLADQDDTNTSRDAEVVGGWLNETLPPPHLLETLETSGSAVRGSKPRRKSSWTRISNPSIEDLYGEEPLRHTQS